MKKDIIALLDKADEQIRERVVSSVCGLRPFEESQYSKARQLIQAAITELLKIRD